MLERIAQRITQGLVRKNIISKADSEIYEFGMFQLIMNMVDTLTILVLAIFFQEISATICFAVSLTLLRRYVGGYHADTVWGCYMLTIFATMTAILTIKYCTIPWSFLLPIWIVSAIIIVLLAPVQTPNKPLDNVECLVYRKRALFSWCIQCVVMFALALLGLKKCFDGILLAQCCMALAMIVGKKKGEDII